MKESKNNLYVNYSLFENDIYIPSRPIERVDKLAPGVYTIKRDANGQIYFNNMQVTSDTLIDLPSFISKQIIEEVNNFWSEEVRKRFDRRGMTYKRGILLHGTHGTGKSSIIIKLMQEEVERGGIVFFCPTPTILSAGAKIVREIQGDVRMLVVFEEFEKILYQDESNFLSLLDGELQIDNVVYIATTNYISEIPPRIKDRPSRFATVVEVPLPDAETRRLFIEAKTFPDENVNIEAWVEATEGMTIDHIKDLIISVFCIGVSLEEAAERAKNMINSRTALDELEDLDPYSQPSNNKKMSKAELLSRVLHGF